MPTLLGIPLDVNSSYLRGAAGAPAKIREAMRCDASNKWTELGVDLGATGAFADAGDLRLNDSQEKVSDDFAEIERGVDGLLGKNECPVSLGGDHSVTYPILKAFARHYPELTIVHFDAHPDLYDEFEGSSMSHACPFARIMEEGLAKRLIEAADTGGDSDDGSTPARAGGAIRRRSGGDGCASCLPAARSSWAGLCFV